MDKWETAARAEGWVRDGDNEGIIYNTNHYESWKAAISWAPENGLIYDSWEVCCIMEGIGVVHAEEPTS